VLAMQTLQKQLGESVGWIVDTLLQDEPNSGPPEEVKKIKDRKREALESLAYVRDVLLGSVSEIEEERLVGEAEFKKRKEKLIEDQEVTMTGSVSTPEGSSDGRPTFTPPPLPQPARPPAVSLNESRHRLTASRSSPQNISSTSHTPRSPSFNQPRLESSRSVIPPSLPSSSPAFSGSEQRDAPWNYTRSSFSDTGASSVNIPSLAPPPKASMSQSTSTAFYPRHPPEGQVSRDQTPGRVQHDPLGVL